jgi:hypothetical protein
VMLLTPQVQTVELLGEVAAQREHWSQRLLIPVENQKGLQSYRTGRVAVRWGVECEWRRNRGNPLKDAAAVYPFTEILCRIRLLYKVYLRQGAF